MSGHKRVWAQTCLGTNVSGHKRVWAQTCQGTNFSGHKRVVSLTFLALLAFVVIISAKPSDYRSILNRGRFFYLSFKDVKDFSNKTFARKYLKI